MITAMSASAWHALVSLDIYQIHEVPRSSLGTHPAGCSPGSELGDQRLAALVSAYHADAGPILIGWARSSPTGPVAVYVGGTGLAGTEGNTDHAVMSLPAGARAQHLPTGTIADVLAAVPYWTPIAAITDGLLTDDQPRTGQESLVRPSLEDCLLGVWREAFAWLVIAEPLTGTNLDKLIEKVGNDQRHARTSSSPDDVVKTQRLEHQHRELSQAVSTGLWRTHFLAGGTSPNAAKRIAALLCSSTDLDRLPYALVPGSKPDQLETLLDTDVDIHGGDSPFYATSPLLAAIAKPPALEVPGVHFRLRPEFDVTPEPTIDGNHSTDDAGLRLGDVLDRNRMIAGPMLLPRSSLNRHTFVCGATGAGKSQTIRGLLQACTSQGLPWLVIEPAKAEYRLMAARLAGTSHTVIAIRPGDVDVLPVGINPLEPALDADGRRYPLQTHADLVRALFLAAFQSHEPFPQVLSAALTRCYEQLGWDLALGEPRTPGVRPRYPTLADLQHAAEQVVDEIGYSERITDDIRGFIRVRLSSLRLGTTGRFFESGHPLNFDALLKNNVVFEIEDVGDDRDKAFLMGTVLIRLIEHLRLEQRRRGGIMPLQHITVIEEAHRLLRRTEETGPAAHAVEMFAGLLAEIRAYGEGLIIAEQIPSKLLPDVIKNTAIKIVHRLPAQDDRDAVGATMNITTTQSEYLVTLQPGHAAVFTDGMDYPLLVAMQDGTSRETSSPTTPASPANLVASRSPICGRICRQRPCTLREIHGTEDHIKDNPRLTLWIELLTIAHLVGQPAPRPEKTWLNNLKKSTDQRTLECAIAHRIQASIDSRYTGLAAYYQPEALAIHLAACAFGLLDGTTPPCDGSEVQWQAGEYRWIDVLRALRNNTSDKDQQHADTEEWARRGLQLTGRTQAQQLKELRDHPDNWQPPRTIITGTGTPPVYQTALAQLSHIQNPRERFLNATRFLHLGTTWPLEPLDIANPNQRGGTA